MGASHQNFFIFIFVWSSLTPIPLFLTSLDRRKLVYLLNLSVFNASE